MNGSDPKQIVGDSWIAFEGKRYDVAPGQSGLEAMLAGGANVVFSCRKGTCRSCMMEAVSGDPGPEARSPLPKHLRDQNFFLPCTMRHPHAVEARMPDPARSVSQADIVERVRLGTNIYKVVLETHQALDWRPGQFITIRRSGTQMRSYSIASCPEDYYLELHIRHYQGGAVSDWLVNQLDVGATIDFVGPAGHCHYRDQPDSPLLLIASGCGAGTLAAVAQDALTRGHRAPIRLVHGARRPEDHYLRERLDDMAARFTTFSVDYMVADAEISDVARNAIGPEADLGGHLVYLCGAPDMVETGRIAALRHGAALEDLFSDPFESPAPYRPRDSEKISGVEADSEMWAALDSGSKLTAILEDFYTLVFADPRLEPFFRKVTKARLVEKQYSFMADLFTGQRRYFGERPFNSHHWMIISDELFDYRERLFFSVAARHGLPQHLMNRWAALNEMFRREIVKSSMRGQWIDGKEVTKPAFVDEVMTLGTLCDGCQNEVAAGETVRHHLRTGEIFCDRCRSNSSGGLAA
ncbi:FAD-binding oxidoreductase [Defluviimonas sp. WL0002]|uniref:FAD-binding oxidoreductase n=1 Tax=Albidovulum marisflavi TaxID=2984159 RepID=A0ABT2ZER4_9RHOB|nr:FAD-binding oxidoreductase [Defluviimonas sp. WL0002]MCV2869612.1 FAD-binding oxidoreductase [Defluviimonas sp. WL0002]